MPEVGDLAPDFELKSHLEKDKKVKLSDFRGQSNVVIAFYPLAWTPVSRAMMLRFWAFQLTASRVTPHGRKVSADSHTIFSVTFIPKGR